MKTCSDLLTDSKNYLDIRKKVLSTYSFYHYKQIIREFNEYFSKSTLKDVSAINEMEITSFIRTITGKTSTVINKLIVLRKFINYLNSIGYKIFVPELPENHDDYVPYIFSDDEISEILEYLDNLPLEKGMNPLLQYEMPMIIRIMISSGTRISATLHIKLGDFDPQMHTIIIRKGKNYKERIVPLNFSVSKMLIKYIDAMNISNPESYIFPNALNDNEPMKYKSVANKFHNVLLKLNIYDHSGYKTRGPCLHCLRHYFVINSLRKLIAEGIPIDNYIPYLSIYLGHDSLDETEKYLKFSPDIFTDEVELFSESILDILPEVENDED